MGLRMGGLEVLSPGETTLKATIVYYEGFVILHPSGINGSTYFNSLEIKRRSRDGEIVLYISFPRGGGYLNLLIWD